jgi:hypothetical protein
MANGANKRLWTHAAALALGVAVGYGQSVDRATPSPSPSPATTASASDATPTPAEDIEELDEWEAVSPNGDFFAVGRVIPDRVFIQRRGLDGFAVAIFRMSDRGLEHSVFARRDFRQRIISQIEWSPDSKFLLFTTKNSGGHSPWHVPAFLFCVADKSFRDVDAAIGYVVAPQFRFEPPDVAVLEIKKGDDAPEEEVKVSLSKAVDRMPHVR